jgi:signal transduction histidine kinase
MESHSTARRDEFLAILAHELRNPLAPLRNALYLLQMREHDPDVTAIHAIMDRQVQQLIRLVDDLLDLSRVTRGRIGLQRCTVDFASVVEAAVEASRPLLDAARHRFSVRLPGAPVHLDADSTRLAQVFTNLLNNAAKFTPAGGSVWLAAESRDGKLVVTVGDTGIGIPPHLLSDVFEMFRQVASTEHAMGGLGIGLTLVERLVHMHGGTVEAHSDGPGLGSRFVVKLPIAGKPDVGSAATAGREGANAGPGERAATHARRRQLRPDFPVASVRNRESTVSPSRMDQPAPERTSRTDNSAPAPLSSNLSNSPGNPSASAARCRSR